MRGTAVWSHRIVESSDPDEFVNLIRPSGLKMFITERGTFEGSSVLMEIGRLHLQRRSERLARFVEVDLPRPGILFLTQSGPSMFFDGVEIGPEEVALIGADNGYVSRLLGPTSWGHILFSQKDMEAISAAHFAHNAPSTSGCRVVAPSSGALARLRLLHYSAENLTAALPGSSICPEFEHELEQALLQATSDCVSVSSVRTETTAVQHHRMIVRRFREILKADPSATLPMQEISDLVGVSGRTLRMVCQEQFGVSPTQYMLLRRLNLARIALRQSAPDTARVTDIATAFGFWELGRFAVRYRQIFGETPSATLKATGFPGYKPTLSGYALA
jgi:AraC-like DNA-binding protein